MHELATNGTNVLGESRREHHDLLFTWSLHEDLLDVFAHFCSNESVYSTELLENFVTFIDDEEFNFVQL